MNPKVYVTQIPHRRDAQGSWVPAINIGPASKHGDLVVIIPHSSSIIETSGVVKKLDEALRNYDFDRGDYLLMTGDPAIIAIAGAILGEYTDAFRLLKWERTTNSYITVEVRLEDGE